MFPVGCAVSRRSAGLAEPVRDLRPPVAGQSWRYAKHDVFTGSVVDTQVDQVASVGRTVNIDSHTEGSASSAKKSSSSWGMSWLHQYVDPARPGAELPSEVQAPWGMVLVDPHWSHVQVFEKPVPLWPRQFQPGWSMHIETQYKTADGGGGLPWDQTMKAEDWETITVPAGRFRALRYINLINFRASDPNRRDSVRRETIWFAPEVGRWIARESLGSYYVDDSVSDQPYNESGYRWELLQWT